MVREVAEWFPEYLISLMADGAYASFAKRHLPRTALYTEAPPRTPGQRGRSRKNGSRLPTPKEWAASLANDQWQSATVTIRGKRHDRLVSVQQVLGYETCLDQLVLLVLVPVPPASSATTSSLRPI